MAHLLKSKSKVKTAIIHPAVEPIFKLYGQLPRTIDLSSLPHSFFEHLNQTIRLEGILNGKELLVTGPVDKIALLNCPILDLVRSDTLILSSNGDSEAIIEKIVFDAWLSLLHTVIYSVDSKVQLGMLLDIVNKEVPVDIHKKLFSEHKTTEPDIANWADASRAVVQRQAQKWRDYQRLYTTHISFQTSALLDKQ
ncbi:hypothetical protein KIH87_10530 [Paraneptunicella aestuarii]|uniref:hypothetical protein n=1 Tax=Paraneptunicella aestuarii TaxID=2831148 RepID=UPI001E49C7AF|nr:hypothetical protein [Paraneptunicella aestuarii]UAA37184.1 hypothetical protein KIH87_10530 [Paraneptunicella aestuarii]